MTQALANFFGDMFSTIVFVALYAITGSVFLTTAIAIAAGLAQIVYQKLRRRPFNTMEVLSLPLVVSFGALAFVTNDGRFIMAKPSIIQFLIAGVMLRRGWMDRYLPAVAHENLSPHIIVASGYAWAVLMFCLGIANLVVAADCTRQSWVLFVTTVPLTAKFAAFGLQYTVFRSLIVRRLRSTRLTPVPA